MALKIIKKATGKEKLQANEYYALMVEDLENRARRKNSDYLDYSRGWLGWETPSNGKPYISKKFDNRYNPVRGTTYVVKATKSDGTVLIY